MSIWRLLPPRLADGFDPNFWGEDHVKADEPAWKALVESNRKAFQDMCSFTGFA